MRRSSRAAIHRAVVLPGEPAQVVLRLRGFQLPVQLRMGSAGDAGTLLRALGLDDAHTVTELEAAPGVLVDARLAFVPLLLMVAQIFLTLKLDMALLGWPVFILLAQAGQLIQGPTRVRIGADGITLGWMWRRR